MKTIPEYQILSYRFSLNPKKLTELYHNFADDYLAVKHAVQDSKSKRVRDIEKYLKKTSDVDLRFLKKTWKLRGSNLKYKMADHIPIGSLDLPTALAIRLKVILGSDSIPGTTSLTLGTAKQKQQQQQKAKAKAKAVEQQSKQRDAIYKEYRTLMRGLGMNLMYDIDALFREFKKPVSEKVGARLRGDKAPQWLYDRLDEYRLKYMIPGHIPRVWIKDAWDMFLFFSTRILRERVERERVVKPKGGELIEKRNGPPPERMYKYELVLERPSLVQEYGWNKDVHLDVTKAYKRFKKDRNDENWNLIVKDFIDLYSVAPNDSLYIKTTRTNTDYYYNTYAPKYEELVKWRDYITEPEHVLKNDDTNMILSPDETNYEEYKDKLLRRFRAMRASHNHYTGVWVMSYLKDELRETIKKWSAQKKWKKRLSGLSQRKAKATLRKYARDYVSKDLKSIYLEFARRGIDVYDEINRTKIHDFVEGFKSVSSLQWHVIGEMARRLTEFMFGGRFVLEQTSTRPSELPFPVKKRRIDGTNRWVSFRVVGQELETDVQKHKDNCGEDRRVDKVDSEYYRSNKIADSYYEKFWKGKEIDWYDYNIHGNTMYFVVVLKDRVLVFTFIKEHAKQNRDFFAPAFRNTYPFKLGKKTSSSRKRTPASMKRALELLEKK